MVNRASIAGVTRSRILVLQCASDSAGQYIACMNAIFSAQRLGIVIDGICPTMEASSFIEQVRFCLCVCVKHVPYPSSFVEQV
jgi:Flp pilus assembly protein TadB